MRRILPALLPLAFAIATLAAFSLTPSASSASASPDGISHIRLNRSAPARDTVLAQSPSEVRLWFSGIPQAGTTSIRLLQANREPVTAHVVDVAADPADGTVQFSQIHGALPAGAYVVVWATVAQDGATADGEIPFTVGGR